MIKCEAAYSASAGALLDVSTTLTGGVAPPAAVAAIGDLVARLVHHVVAVYGNSVDPEELIDAMADQAIDVYDTLPELTEADHEAARAQNFSTAVEPPYRVTPSGADEQIVTCELTVRVDGFRVFKGGASSSDTPFAALPIIAAGTIASVAGIGLTSMIAPAHVEPIDEPVAAMLVRQSLAKYQEVGKLEYQAAVTRANERRLAKLIQGELDERN